MTTSDKPVTTVMLDALITAQTMVYAIRAIMLPLYNIHDTCAVADAIEACLDKMGREIDESIDVAQRVGGAA